MDFVIEALLLLATLAFVGGLGYLQYRNSDKQRMKRALRKNARVPIAAAQDGKLVRLSGKLAYATDPIEAPLSGRSCAYYRVEVERPTSESRERVIEETSFCPEMWLEDESSRALIEMKAPTVALVMDDKSHTGLLRETTTKQLAFLYEHGQASKGRFTDKKFNFAEGVLETGEEIAVFGLCKMEIDPEPRPDGDLGYREIPMRARIVDPPGGRMLISDEPSVLAAAQASSRERER